MKLATGYLDKHGSSSPRLDAELLLAHSLGLRRLDLYLNFERPLAETELAPYRELVARRGGGEPVAYLTGHKEFMGLDFEVTPAVLVPNPDTEALVGRAVEWGRGRESLRIADVGTGSGAIAIALAHFLPPARIDAADISPEALAIARRNVARHSLEARVSLFEGDLLEPLPGPYDLIAANLPYLPDGMVLPDEVAAQPAIALYGGARLVNVLLEQAPAKLAAGGRVMLEVDVSMLADVVLEGWAGHTVHRDLAGHDRVLELWT